MRSYSTIVTPRPEVLDDEGMIDMVDLASLAGSKGKKGGKKRRRLADVAAAADALRDPARFFAITYPTEDIVSALRALQDRFDAGEANVGTIVLSGRYGLGKSHVLLAAHHALSAPDQAASWAASWDIEPLTLPANVRVVTRSFIHQTAENLWDVVFEAFGCPELSAKVQDYPDSQSIEALLDDRHTVLIFDELERWYDALDSNRQSRNRNFIQALSEAARRNPKITLVTSVLGEKAEPAETLRRVKPVELAFRSEDDRQRVLLFRLFEDYAKHDAAAASEVVDAYVEAYRTAGLEGLDAYRERMRQTYPFTPEFLDILTRKVPLLKSFQNTRGSLRFLARIVRATHESAAMVGSPHLPISESEIVRDLGHLDSMGGEVVRRALGDNYDAVPKDLAHKDALFSAILLYSIADPTHPGITEDDLVQATLEPGQNPNTIKDSLRRLRRFAFNLHLLDDRYLFRSQENPEARIHAVAESQQVTREAIFGVIEEMLLAAWGAPKQTALFGRNNEDLSAVAQQLKSLGSAARPLFLVSTQTLSERLRLKLQNLHDQRNLVLLIEPNYKPERDADYAYELLTDPELEQRARVVEACRRLLSGKPEASSAAVYRSVMNTEEARLQKLIGQRYGHYVDWDRAGADDAPVDGDWYAVARFEEFSAARFVQWFEREFGGDPLLRRELKAVWSEFLRRPVRDLVAHFEQTPGRAIPHRSGMVEEALLALAEKGELGLETPDGVTHCHENVRELPSDIALAILVEPTAKSAPPPPPRTLPTHQFASAYFSPDQGAVRVEWKPPSAAGAHRTLVQRYLNVRTYEVGKAYNLDLDLTHNANRYLGTESAFVDGEVQRGVLYHYYVFLVTEAAPSGSDQIVLSQRCDVPVPAEDEPDRPDTIIVPPQVSHDALLTELEKRVMSAKTFPAGKVVARMEFEVRGAPDLPALGAMLNALPVAAGKARSVADLRITVRGPLGKLKAMDVAKSLPKVKEATYAASLVLADEEP